MDKIIKINLNLAIFLRESFGKILFFKTDNRNFTIWMIIYSLYILNLILHKFYSFMNIF